LPMLLEVRGLTKFFGGLAAVHELDIHINTGEIVGLIGPNGAGKTTLFNLITGVTRASKGKVIFEGEEITGTRPNHVAELGIARTFQFNPLFGDFTVLQNVSASFHLHPRSRVWDMYLNTAAYRRNEAYILKHALEILHLVGLEDVKDELAKNLPHGYQKMLGIARALAIKPRLLLLDEPIAGMSSDEIDGILTAIHKIHRQGVTLLVVEHNMRILDLCKRVVVISFGRKIAEGSPKEVRKNKEVIEAYFGDAYVA
jgi:branched-chain amino acid transport system ATP-binding protein